MTLKEFFMEHPKVALAFSGGTDSSYLLYMACKYAKVVQPYFLKTPFQPAFEREDAGRLAGEMGIALVELGYDILQEEHVRQNDPLRCYHCKTQLFGLLKERAARDGFGVLIDGTNASDQAEDRPGMRALRELAVLSPLQACGLSKPEIIALSREAGLFTWKKPAYACLATRIPTGTPITHDALCRIERGENALFRLGFRDFRLRLMGKSAKLQIRAEDFEKAIARRADICAGLSEDFDDIVLDLRDRTGGVQYGPEKDA